jgi:MSHA pilin protein MshC
VKGFTVIELVTVIVLLGIVTAVVAPRWFGTAEFDASVCSTEVLSVARLAQRTAVARPEVDVSLTIVQMGGQWRIEVLADDAGTIAVLHAVSVGVASSIAVTAGIGPTNLSAANSLALTYDALGNTASVLLAGFPGAVDSGVSFDFAGSTDHRLCISPLGFAHAGSCI